MPLVLWTLTNFLSIFSTHFWYGICHIQFFCSLAPKLPLLNHQFDECLGLFCVCLLYVVVAFSCVCVFGCVLFYGNGSMIAMKDIFNKVLPAFFSHWWMDAKNCIRAVPHTYAHIHTSLFNKTVNKMLVPVQLLFFVNTMHTHIHIHIHTVKSLLSSFLCRMRLR